MTQEPQDWKEKYLSALENFEKLQGAEKARIDVLRKGLVRVSLAADGQDAALDEKLAELRSALRSNQDILTLEPQVAELEELVVALDERRRDEVENIEELIGNSLDNFLNTELPRKEKSVIKKYQKSLPKLLDGSGNNVELWTQYSDIQNLLADYIAALEHKDEEAKQGFFQRLFSSGEKASSNDEVVETQAFGEPAAEESSEQPVAEPKPSSTEEDNVTISLSEQKRAEQVVDQAINASGQFSESENPEQREQLRQRIASVLSGLLKKIELPDDDAPKRDDLIQRIETELVWEDLPDILEEAAQLVTSTRVEAQKEFEGFLVALHERLQDIQEFLQTARKGEEEAQLNQQKLDNEVREELRGIKTQVEVGEDIDQIKMDIESMINRIVTVVDDFHRVEKNRRDEAYERIEHLGKRMELMEKEATELRDNLEATRIQAMKDALTELPNRQAYNEHIEREYSRWKRRNYPLSIAMCDIDRFKAINDNLGHLRGDKVLRLVARELSRRVRSEDFVARYGGEEFIIVMPDTDEPSAMAAMEKVRASIEECPFNFNNERILITASFGVTSFKEGDDIVSCFERADKALYKAKSSGRNKVVRSDA